MCNLRKIWVLAVLVILLLSGCATDVGVTEPAPADDNDSSNGVTESPSPTTEGVLSTPSPSSLPVATETAVVTNTSNASTTPQVTQTPIHEMPIPPKTTPSDSGESVDTFLVRTLNTEDSISFEELAVERSKQHLSQMLQISIDEITLISIERAELSNNVCQNPTPPTKGAENHGITLGYEILLMADSQQHHYAILHNLGHYCANK